MNKVENEMVELTKRVSSTGDETGEVMDFKLLLNKKVLSFSQKAAILKAVIVDIDENGVITEKEIESNKEAVQDIRDAALSNFTNVAIISALVGITTYTAMLSPPTISEYDPSEYTPGDGNFEQLYLAYVILNMASTSFNFICIGLCTFFALIVTTWLPRPIDLLWFLSTYPVVIIVYIMMDLAIAAWIFALVTAVFIIFSRKTAIAICLTGLFIVLLLFVIAIPIGLPVIWRINRKIKELKENVNKKFRDH